MSNQLMIPKEVLAAAMLVGEWFANKNAKEWMICDLASRSWLEQLRAENERLKAELAEIRNSMSYRTSLVGRLEQELSALRSQQAAVPAWQDAFAKCKQVAVDSGAYESYKAVGEAFDALEAMLAAALQPSQPSDSYVAKLERLHDAARRFFRTEAAPRAHALAEKDLRNTMHVVTDAQQAGEDDQQPSHQFSSERLKSLVPESKPRDSVTPTSYIEGWNDCRNVMLDNIDTAPPSEDAMDAALKQARNALVQWHVPENRYAAIEAIDAAIQKGGA